MEKFLRIVLYMAHALGANTAMADVEALEALREGDMMKLVFHSEPKPAPQVEFQREGGSPGTLVDYQGKHILLNFWAIWCAPCRLEMPTLSNLQSQMGSEEFTVVTIATGRNPPPAINAFFEEIRVDNLPRHRDPRSAITRQLGVLGLPVTVILDPEGFEIARLQGDAHWNSDGAKAIIAALIDGGGAR